VENIRLRRSIFYREDPKADGHRKKLEPGEKRNNSVKPTTGLCVETGEAGAPI